MCDWTASGYLQVQDSAQFKFRSFYVSSFVNKRITTINKTVTAILDKC